MTDIENQKRGHIGSPVSLADFMNPSWNRFRFRQKQACPLLLVVNSAEFLSQQGTRTCPNQAARCPITSQTYKEIDSGNKEIMGTSVKPRDGRSSSTDDVVVINSSSCEVNKKSGKQKDQQTTAKTTNHRDEQTDRLTVIQKENVKQENLVSNLSSNFMCAAVCLDESQNDDDDQQMSRDQTEPEPPAQNLKWPWKVFKYIESIFGKTCKEMSQFLNRARNIIVATFQTTRIRFASFLNTAQMRIRNELLEWTVSAAIKEYFSFVVERICHLGSEIATSFISYLRIVFNDIEERYSSIQNRVVQFLSRVRDRIDAVRTGLIAYTNIALTNIMEIFQAVRDRTELMFFRLQDERVRLLDRVLELSVDFSLAIVQGCQDGFDVSFTFVAEVFQSIGRYLAYFLNQTSTRTRIAFDTTKTNISTCVSSFRAKVYAALCTLSVLSSWVKLVFSRLYRSVLNTYLQVKAAFDTARGKPPNTDETLNDDSPES